MSENERYSEAAISLSSRLFDQICFAQWLHDTIVDFALVEAVRFLGVNRDSYRSGKVGEVCYGIPCNEKLVVVCAEGQLDLGLRLVGSWRG